MFLPSFWEPCGPAEKLLWRHWVSDGPRMKACISPAPSLLGIFALEHLFGMGCSIKLGLVLSCAHLGWKLSAFSLETMFWM